MAGLTPLTDAQWDALLASGYAAACQRAGIPAATLGEGSQLGAFFYPVRAALMQQQTQLGYAVLESRLANCSGPDVDSFVASFGMSRLLATFSTGQVICTTSAPVVTQIVVPVGANFGTPSGLVFTVIADPTNSAYSQASGGYIIAPTGSSAPSIVSVTVQCTISGTIGNVQPGQITIPLSSGVVPIGIGSITNSAAFEAAINTESDSALKARFQAKFAGGADGGSAVSILATVLGVTPGLTASVADNNNAGTAQNGWFTVIVNTLGATGAPTAELLELVEASVDTVRSGGIRRAVQGSTIVTVNTTAHLVLASGADTVATPAAAVTAVQNYINSIGLDPMGNATRCSPAQIYRAILNPKTNPYAASILDVQSLLLNGASSELTTGFGTQFAAGSIVFD